MEEDENEVALDLEVNQRMVSLSILNKIGDRVRLNDADPSGRADNYKVEEAN